MNQTSIENLIKDQINKSLSWPVYYLEHTELVALKNKSVT